MPKLFETENRKLDIDFINLEIFYKKEEEINEQELNQFIDENADRLKVEYIDFKYSVINPQNLVGISNFNQEFFDKIDQIENNILNGVEFNSIVSEFDLKTVTINDYKYSDKSDIVEKKIYEVRNNKFDIFENDENFILYKIENIQEKKPNIKDLEIKNEILKLISQKNKFDYNRKLLEKIKGKKFTENNFKELGGDKVQSLTLNSIKDNKKFEINSVQILYSLPANSFTLINDEKDKIYLAQVKNYSDVDIDKKSENYKSFINKENTRIRNTIFKSYDFFLNDKYNIVLNNFYINTVNTYFTW